MRGKGRSKRLLNFTTDAIGTAPRLLSYWYYNDLHSQLNWRTQLFEEYEIAIMEGEYYDWSKYAKDIGIITPPD